MSVISQKQYRSKLKNYIVGFALSIALTLAAYFVVVEEKFSALTLLIIVGVLAIIQCMVQLIYFLHLAEEAKPRWRFMILLYALLVVVIVIFGTLWIMQNLDYHHGSLNPEQLEQYIIEDEGYAQ